MLLPPMHEWTWTLMKSPIASMTFSVWVASSRVGDNTRAWTLRRKEEARRVRKGVEKEQRESEFVSLDWGVGR